MKTVTAYSRSSDLACFFKEASEKKLRLLIRGFGTQSEPEGDRLIVSTRGFDTITADSAGDLTVTAGSGVPYQRLKDVLTPLSDDWPDYPGSIGGCICGDRHLPAHIFLVSRILMMTIVRSNGDVVDLGSRSVKDVAGYRIAPLFFGSGGKLGLITGVTFNKAPVYRDYSPVTANEKFSLPSNSEEYVRGLQQLFDHAGILK